MAKNYKCYFFFIYEQFLQIIQILQIAQPLNLTNYQCIVLAASVGLLGTYSIWTSDRHCRLASLSKPRSLGYLGYQIKYNRKVRS